MTARVQFKKISGCGPQGAWRQDEHLLVCQDGILVLYEYILLAASTIKHYSAQDINICLYTEDKQSIT
jgi:hypothetical protein